METLPLDQERSQNFEALLAFFEGMRVRAESLGHGQLASIAIEAGSLDPLAVLESIYDPCQLHFYVERKQEGFALAGAEEALRFEPRGSERFAEARRFVEESLEHCISVGDASLPFFGPHFFCGFAFFDEVSPGTPFPAATLFVPRWQVGLRDGRCVAIANAYVDKDSDVGAIAQRIWNANTKFRSFDYGEAARANSLDPRSRLRLIHKEEVGAKDGFEVAVLKALESIESGELAKIVLARALDLQADQPFHPLEILNTLRERYADCFAFSFANGRGQSFIGASPERLLSTRHGKVYVDVLAGTAPRGVSASEDAQLGGALLRSDKDRREHAIVFDSVRRRLASLGIEARQSCQPRLKKLQNVQHLYVELVADLPEGVAFFDVAAALHPTPAVGGNPREPALKRIPELEPFERGWYAGAIGWVNAAGDGELVVGIRSALVDGMHARLFAGVGIVRGSKPERERAEGDLKFKALLENLL